MVGVPHAAARGARDRGSGSVKARVERMAANHYVLPKSGAIKADAHAFLSEAIFAGSEESAWSQIAHGASYEGVVGAYLMPDTHTGFGVPIGSVIVTEDTVIQCGSGYDISCGVLMLRAQLSAEDVADKTVRARWVKEIEKRIATGIGTKQVELERVGQNLSAEDVLRYGALSLGVDEALCERQYIPIPEDTDLSVIERAYQKALPQLGSVGAGNHFVEVQCDHDDASVWVMVHCGSRGYGYGVADHFFRAGADLRGLPAKRRDNSWLRIDEPLGKQYWAHHNSAANFAVANRHVIAGGVRGATQAVFGRDVEVYYEISHNLVQEETLVLPDGSTAHGFVHRKGATRAFPAGHPQLVGTAWERTGHPRLIPGSMYEGAAVLFAGDGAYKSACSVNHGSGRVLGRREAKRQLGERQAEIDEQMATVRRSFAGVEIEGIVGNHATTPLDECAHVYKDLDAVLSVLSDEGIATVTRRLYPVCNIKGAD